jgi:hypothetical protein
MACPRCGNSVSFWRFSQSSLCSECINADKERVSELGPIACPQCGCQSDSIKCHNLGTFIYVVFAIVILKKMEVIVHCPTIKLGHGLPAR